MYIWFQSNLAPKSYGFSCFAVSNPRCFLLGGTLLYGDGKVGRENQKMSFSLLLHEQQEEIYGLLTKHSVTVNAATPSIFFILGH